MNTTKKGDILEDKIYELFHSDIVNDRFWAKKECCKIYKQKGYYSRDRKKKIIFDIAIEIFLPRQTSFSSLVLIECKNHNKKIPVGEVESFLMKAQQVSGGNVKAIVASNNSFQEGAFNFCKSKGIGLLRYYDRNNHDWVLTRSPSSAISPSFSLNQYSTAYTGLHSNAYQSRYFDFYGYINHQYTNSTKLFFDTLIKYGQGKKYIEKISLSQADSNINNSSVEYKGKSEIETVCNDLLSKINYQSGEVPLYDLCDYLSKNYGLKLIENSELPDGVLGQITFSPLEIQIQTKHKNNASKRFTLAHELGHLLLGHSKYMSGEKYHSSSLDMESPKKIEIQDIVRMEWQANHFASCILLPQSPFIKSFRSIVARNNLINRGFGVLYLDNQKCNQDAYYSITSPLMKKYKVSRQAIKIRLKRLGLIKEVDNFLGSDKFATTFNTYCKEN